MATAATPTTRMAPASAVVMDEALLAENVDEPDSSLDDFLESSCPGPTLPPFLPPFLPLPSLPAEEESPESPSRPSVFVQPDPPPDPHNLRSGAIDVVVWASATRPNAASPRRRMHALEENMFCKSC
jgi:hypothetical protein